MRLTGFTGLADGERFGRRRRRHPQARQKQQGHHRRMKRNIHPNKCRLERWEESPGPETCWEFPRTGAAAMVEPARWWKREADCFNTFRPIVVSHQVTVARQRLARAPTGKFSHRKNRRGPLYLCRPRTDNDAHGDPVERVRDDAVGSGSVGAILRRPAATIGAGEHLFPTGRRAPALCEKCPLCVVRCGVSYCGTPLLLQIDRDPIVDGLRLPLPRQGQ